MNIRIKMKNLNKFFRKPGVQLATFGILAISIEICGGVYLGNSCSQLNCERTISYYYQNSKPEDFCKDLCTEQVMMELIDAYQGKIDLQEAYRIAKERCEK